MTDPIDQLIDNLSRNVAPVNRLRPPLIRAAFWLGTFALISGLIVAKFADLHIVAVRAEQPVFIVALIAALATGCLAIGLGYINAARHWPEPRTS